MYTVSPGATFTVTFTTALSSLLDLTWVWTCARGVTSVRVLTVTSLEWGCSCFERYFTRTSQMRTWR